MTPAFRLPEHIELTLAEATLVLEVMDLAVEACRTTDEREWAEQAVRMVTAKLWPELGDLLEGDDQA